VPSRPSVVLRRARLVTLASGLCLAACAIQTAAAGAAGCGYTPCTSTSGAESGFKTVVAASTISTHGGTLTGSAHGATATVTVPKGSLARPGEIVLASGAPASIAAGPGLTVVIGFSVDTVDPNTGAKLEGPFDPPLTLTIKDPSISPNDEVVFISAPARATVVAGARLSTGKAVVSFASDPNVAVVRPSAPLRPPRPAARVTNSTLSVDGGTKTTVTILCRYADCTGTISLSMARAGKSVLLARRLFSLAKGKSSGLALTLSRAGQLALQGVSASKPQTVTVKVATKNGPAVSRTAKIV
jgi:hypothetical protein